LSEKEEPFTGGQIAKPQGTNVYSIISNLYIMREWSVNWLKV